MVKRPAKAKYKYRIYDPSAGPGISGVCYNCLNGGHGICDRPECACRRKRHKSWWWIRESDRPSAKPGTFEIRKQDGELDEVVACRPKLFHLEQMDDGHWWMRIDLPGGRAVVVNLWSKGKIRGRAEVE